MIKNLSVDGVSIVTIGESGLERHTPYYNNNSGRTTLAAEQPPDIVAEVMEVWGDKPTMPDYMPEPMPEPTPAEQIYSLKRQISDTDYKIIKCSECQLANMPLPYDVQALHKERQTLRDKINVLESATH